MTDSSNMGVLATYPSENKSKRPYVRRTKKDAFIPTFPTSPPQISDLAFNIHGWALEDAMKKRGIFEVINAQTSTMTRGGFNAKLQDIVQNLEPGDELYRSNLQYTARELDVHLAERDSSVSQYLVVGYTLQEDDPIFLHNQTFSRYSENELVGERQPSGQHFIKWNDCKTPILVVSPIKQNTGTSVRHFGLVKPKDGLCQPVLLTHERIFYRWEFRASAGAKSAQRNKNWNQLIVQKALALTPIDKLVKPEDQEAKVSLKRKRSRATIKQEVEDGHILEAREPEDLHDNHLELNLIFDNLLQPVSQTDQKFDILPDVRVMSNVKIMLDTATRAVITNIRTSRTDETLQKVRAILKKVEMPKVLPELETINLSHFGIAGSVITVQDAHAVVNEINTFWPELAFLVTVDKIMFIKHVMNNCFLSVDLELMEKFLSNALALIPYDLSIAEDVLSWKLIEFHQLASTIYQAHAHRARASVHDSIRGEDAMFLTSLLRDVLRHDQWQKNAVRHTATPWGCVGQTFEYKVSFDVEKERQELDNTVQELSKHAKDKGCGTADIVLWAERLRLLIRQA